MRDDDDLRARPLDCVGLFRHAGFRALAPLSLSDRAKDAGRYKSKQISATLRGHRDAPRNSEKSLLHND
jgi:hypothetical protein